MKILPPRVRRLIYLVWFGMALAGLGMLGFFLSYSQVASPEVATVDVHYDIPVLAYASILAWVVGLVVVWMSRRAINKAVKQQLESRAEAMYVEFGAIDAQDARES